MSFADSLDILYEDNHCLALNKPAGWPTTHFDGKDETVDRLVKSYLREKYKDPDLDHEVGLLWLGEEFAQLDKRFCEWQRSGTDSACTSENLNRSAFISWIDCQL